MGQMLIIKGADFFGNAIDNINLVDDVVKETDLGNSNASYPLGVQYWYNSIPLEESVTITAFSFKIANNYVNNKIRIGATDGNSVLRNILVDLSFLDEKINAGEISKGTIQTVLLTSPLTINAGEYICVASTQSTCIIGYARTPSGDNGYMTTVGSSSLTSYNLGMRFYGVKNDI